VNRVLDELLSRRVLFVTGKGGTGKSTIAAALALLANRRGLRVLLVDVEAKGDAARFLDAGPSMYRAKEVRPGLAHLAMHPEDILDEYLRVVLKVPRLYRLGPLHRVFDFIATAAPGVAEVLVAGKIGFEERATENGRPRWDLIVVDAAPTGQILSHIRGPRTMIELVKVGMIRNQTEWVRAILEDPARTGIVVVSLPEEMPVSETEELLERAPQEVQTPILALVANRVVAEPKHQKEAKAVAKAKKKVAPVMGASIEPALDAYDLVCRVSANQAPHLERLRTLGPAVMEVPSLPLGHHEMKATQQVAEALSS
jgi:anion-transporting  ArsA/GET3 family ATPase